MTMRHEPPPRTRPGILRVSFRWCLGLFFVCGTPFAANGSSIYESVALGPLASRGDPPPVVVADQSIGVKFHVSDSVTTGSIGGHFAPYSVGIDAHIVGAIVRLDGPHDFPNSFDLTSEDVLGKVPIQVSEPAGDFAGDLRLTLTEGWYALIFVATGIRDKHNAILPRMDPAIESPLYFFGRVLTDAPEWFGYLDGGGLDGVRMFVATGPAPVIQKPVPVPVGSAPAESARSVSAGTLVVDEIAAR